MKKDSWILEDPNESKVSKVKEVFSKKKTDQSGNLNHKSGPIKKATQWRLQPATPCPERCAWQAKCTRARCSAAVCWAWQGSLEKIQRNDAMFFQIRLPLQVFKFPNHRLNQEKSSICSTHRAKQRSTDALAFSHWSNPGNDTLVMRRVVASIHTHWTRARATATSSASICMMSRSSKGQLCFGGVQNSTYLPSNSMLQIPQVENIQSHQYVLPLQVYRGLSLPVVLLDLQGSHFSSARTSEEHHAPRGIGDANSSLAGTTVTRGSLVKAGHLDELGCPASPERTTKSWAETHTASVRELTRQSCQFSESSVWSRCF